MVLEKYRDRGNLNPLFRYFFVDLYVYSAAFSAATSWFSASFVTPGTKLSICLSGMASIIAAIFQSTFPRGERQQILTIFHLYIRISNPNLHFNITPFHIFYLIHFFWACFFQLFMVRIFWGFSVYFWFALYRNNT